MSRLEHKQNNSIMFIEEIDGIILKFETNTGCARGDAPHAIFSPGKIDTGTLAMLSVASFEKDDKVLDLGCGYGVVGIFASKKAGCENVVMCDILHEAAALSRQNAALNGIAVIGGSEECSGVRIIQSNAFENIHDRDFSIILSNPPYHTDFSVAKRFIEGGFAHLRIGGRMVMVTKRLDWYKNKLTSVFGGVKVIEKDGYYVFISEKRSASRNLNPAKNVKTNNKLSRKLERKMSRQIR